jgi:2-polyprenyl-3-methyl-5-hydroxy-6-metoxy-1,4-benzoquinol methylase
MYEGLEDSVFFSAPGKWNLFRCDRCGSAYLDPCPSSETIGLAYRTYFTHVDQQNNTRKGLRRVSQLSRNAYLNSSWGTKLEPASKYLAWVQRLMPGNTAYADYQMRHLPHPARGRRLLDVGCGNGLFLSLARSAGWNVVGFDLDPDAVRVAREKGLDVRLGNFDTISEQDAAFDAITLSHVIEHVDSPFKLLVECRRLLKTDGFFWLETPNIESAGHRKFRRNWRGLEIPRHLTIFSRSALIDLLHRAGFSEVHDAPWAPKCDSTWPESDAIANGSLAPTEARPNYLYRLLLRAIDRALSMKPQQNEFITLIADSPDCSVEALIQKM